MTKQWILPPEAATQAKDKFQTELKKAVRFLARLEEETKDGSPLRLTVMANSGASRMKLSAAQIERWMPVSVAAVALLVAIISLFRTPVQPAAAPLQPATQAVAQTPRPVTGMIGKLPVVQQTDGTFLALDGSGKRFTVNPDGTTKEVK